jgi:uncharacterized protein
VDLFLVTLASLCAGLVDSIAGGGGLILVPSLFAVFPIAEPATLLGTNKSASIWGTAIALRQYSRRVQMRWSVLLPAAALACGGSFIGAWTVTLIDPTFVRRMMPVALFALLAYTLLRKDLGRVHAPPQSQQREVLLACLIAAALGWYDGFFGPGTGSFFIFLLVRVLGYDFLNASAAAKLLNVSTNLAALTLFAAKGHIWWHIGAAMAIANIAGSLIGSRLALKHGAGFVRQVFMVVVGGLVLKTGYDAFLG